MKCKIDFGLQLPKEMQTDTPVSGKQILIDWLRSAIGGNTEPMDAILQMQWSRLIKRLEAAEKTITLDEIEHAMIVKALLTGSFNGRGTEILTQLLAKVKIGVCDEKDN